MGIASQGQDRHPSVSLIVALAAFTIYVVGIRIPQVIYYWQPQGDFGIRDVSLHGWPFITEATVKELASHSPATDAGIRVGDTIEQKYLNLHERLVALGPAQPGEVWPVHLIHNGKHRLVTLVARPVYLTASQIKSDILGQISTLLRVILGLGVVLLRPGRMAWLFYIWMLSGGSYSDYLLTLPSAFFVAAVVPYTLLIGSVPFTSMLFLLVFPNDELVGWRRRGFPVVVAALIAAAAFELARFLAFILNIDTSATDWVGNATDIVGELGTVFVLVYYIQASVAERKRIQWILLVLIGGAILETGKNVQQLLSPGAPPGIWDWIWYWGVLIPLVFAYAIVRYRMFDIEFVLNRAVVYSVLLIAAIGIFVAVDGAFTSHFHGSRAELAVDIAVALGIGFWVRAIQGTMIDLVDRALFRRRYDSRTQLKVTLGAIATADSPRAIEQIVTSGAATALGLASAVFFRCVADGGFLREVGFGWPADGLWHLLPDDKLIKALECDARPVDLYALDWSRTAMPAPQKPVLAVPMKLGGRYIGVTLYGSRLNGVLPSPDEVGGLVELSQRAASAYLMLDSVRSKITPRDLASARISR